MIPLAPVDVRDLFPVERAALLDLLGSLTVAEWAAATACAGWSVMDVAVHLLGDDVGRLAGGRDGAADPAFRIDPELEAWPGLVAAIDCQNAIWVAAARRLSPRLVIDLLRLTGEQTDVYFSGLNLDELGGPVDWASPGAAPVWLDLAREYTERWVHQQHIRDATGRPGLTGRKWLHPVLATLGHGLPRALAGAAAPEGAIVRLRITGEAGDSRVAVKSGGRWLLGRAAAGPISATVELDQETAWRLFTKGITPAAARQSAIVSGDPVLADRVLTTVSILG